MKLSIPCLLLPLALLSSLRATSSAETTTAIPFAQLGMEADKKGAAAASSITPMSTGARLKAVMQDIVAEATPKGLWLTSTAEEDAGKANRFRMRATALGRASSFGLSSTGTVYAAKQSVAWIRPGLIEEYSVSSDGVRQDFVVMQRPAGVGSELTLELELTGAQAVETEYGVKLTITATGRELAYSRLKVTDASGKELSAHFDIVNPERPRITVQDVDAVYPVRIDPTFSDADWVAMNTGIPGANGTVEAITVDSSGNLYVGGSFTAIGTVAATRIAKWNGSAWSALGAGMNGTVHELTVSDSDLYAGGSFTTAGGVSANRIAKWNGSAWSTLGAGVNNQVTAIVVIGNILYAGGVFTTAGASNASYIAKWNGSSWTSVGSGLDNYVSALAVIGGNLYAGGGFTMSGQTTVNRIAKWNGSAWSALGSGLDDSVNTLAVSGSDLYAAGSFRYSGGTLVRGIAKWNGSAWSALGLGLSGDIGSRVLALAVSGSDLYAGGVFNTADSAVGAQNIAKWNGSSWSALGPGLTGTEPYVGALAVISGNLYAGGRFATSGGTQAEHIAKWDGIGWSAISTGMNNQVNALALIGNDLYIGGSFTTVGSVSAKHIAKWDGSAWSTLDSGMGGNNFGGDYVYALAVNGSDLYVGGSFTRAGGIYANRIAKWNGSTWSALYPGFFSSVRALAVNGNNLYAGGDFSQSGGGPGNFVAKWNGSTWSALGSGVNSSPLGTYPSVYALAVRGSDLFVGGRFTMAGGVANTSYIAKWNGSSWSALGSGMNFDVYALAVSGSDLYAGGGFSTAGGTSANSIAKWDGSTWSALGSGLDSSVYALAVSGSDLYAGGLFATAGGTSANSIAKWNGSAWSALGSGVNGGSYPYTTKVSALVADNGGHLFLGGNFVTVGTNFSPYIAQANLPLTALEIWRRDHFGIIGNSGSAADTADADGDGMANLLEWATNLNPTTSSTSPAVLAPNGAGLEFTYPRSVTALNAGAVFNVEWSDTLPGGSWSTAGVIQAILSDNGTVQQVKATLPAGSGGKRFVRLRVTSPP